MADRNRDPFEPDPRERRRRRREQSPSDDYQYDQPKRRRWPWILLILLVIVALLPNLIGWFGLHNQLLPMALGDFQGDVKIRSASIGWFQPVKLQGVEANDLAGNPLATIEEIQTSKKLYEFVSGSDYGEVTIQKPVVFFRGRPDGSNVEDAISRYLADSQPSPLNEQSAQSAPLELPKMLVNVHDGAARIEAQGSNQVWQIDGLEVSAATSGSEAPLVATAQFRASSFSPNGTGELVPNESGTVWLNSVVDAGSNALTFSTADVSAKSEQFPLSVIAPLSQRFIGNATIGGTASSEVRAAWKANTNEVAANIQTLQLVNPQIDAPDLLNGDTLRVEQLTAQGALQLSPSRIFAEQFVVETDFGRVDANGQFDPGELAKLSGGTSAQGVLPDSDLQVQGEIDIAKLLQRLPSTFQLHQDLRVESGKLQFTAGQRNDSDAKRLIVNVDTANLRAVRGGQPIVWQTPLRVVGVVRESGGKLSLESLNCISEFLNIDGTATLQEGVFRVSGNLGSLSKRIRQFADLGPIQFDGQLDGQFGWQVKGGQAVDMAALVNQPFQMGGEFTIKQPVIELPDLPRWSPAEIVIRTSGSGQMNGNSENSTLRLAQAGAQLTIGSENAVVSLARPVEDAFTNQQWIFNSQVTGEVSNWLAHVRNFVDPGDFEAGGKLSFAGVTIVESDRVRVERGQYEIQRPGFLGYGVNIQEDRIVGQVVAEYLLESGNVGVQRATVQGTGISATAQDLKLTMGEAMQLAGSAAWQADVNRIADWLQLQSEPDSINFYGAVDGTIDFANSPQGTNATIEANLTDLVATQRVANPAQTQPIQMAGSRQSWSEIWREKRVNLNGKFSLGSDFDSLQLDQLTTRSGSLDFDARGSITELAGAMNLNLEGTWQPNFDRIQSLLAAASDDLVTLSGGGATESFRVVGPLFETSASSRGWVSDRLEAHTTLQWDKAQLAGLPIGQGGVAVDLQRQMAMVRTGDRGVPVSGGMVLLRPQIDLRGDDLVLIHGEGKLLDRVQLTPEICSESLKFVAPLLADTTNAQGIFSADLQGLNMPLSDPMKMSARGTLVLQDVTVAAGPMAEQLLDSVTQLQSILKPDSRQRQLKTWLRIEEQSIPVAVENGRVYHEGIQFSHDEMIIRTSGSVGFDQSLNLVAKIPIAEEWLEGSRYLAGLRGQSISIPIGGTVNRPRIDQNEVRKLSSELVKNAAQGALNSAITDKISPKVTEYQNQLNNKVSSEVGKLQNQLQSKVGGLLGEKFGLPAAQQAPAASGGSSATPSVGQQVEERLNNELKNGFNRLFGG